MGWGKIGGNRGSERPAGLFFLGVRRGEALGLKWGDFNWEKKSVHIERNIDYVGARAKEGSLKTYASERTIPVPDPLLRRLQPKRGLPDMFLFRTDDWRPIPQASFQRLWLSLMQDAGCVEEREEKEWGKKRKNDVRYKLKATLTPHYFRHNFITLLYEKGIDPLIAMKIVGHTDYQTTANIYTHLKEETLKAASHDLNSVFMDKKLLAQMQDLGK